MKTGSENSVWKRIEFIGPKYVLAVLLLSVSLRMAVFVVFQPWTPRTESEYVLRNDGLDYHRLATTLIESHRFAYSNTDEPDALRTPLYPMLVALIYSLAGHKPWIVILVQIMIDAMSSLLLLLSLSQLLSRRVALIASAFYALDPFLILHSSTTLVSDTFFVFLLVVAFWFLSGGFMRNSGRRTALDYALSSLFLGLATLVRPISQYLPVCYFIFFLVAYWKRPRVAVTYSVLTALVCGLVMSPWLFRNHSTFGFFSLSTSGSYNLLVLDVVPMEMAARHQDARAVRGALLAEADNMIEADGLCPQDLNGFQRAQYWQRLAIKYIANAPIAFGRSYFLGVTHTLFNLDTRSYAEIFGLPAAGLDIKAHTDVFDLARAFLKTRGVVGVLIGSVIALFLFISYLGAAVGLLVSWRRYNRPFLFLMLVLAIYFVLITGAAGLARFKLPSIPFYVAFTGIGLGYLYEKRVLRVKPKT